MDRTGKRHMGRLDDDYKLIVIIQSAYVLRSKLIAIDVRCCPEICRDTSIAQA
jgi:hypothetical protein